jgi:hypothetical protein
MIDKAFDYEKQVTHVDAFLYANQRIAGKTFMAPMVINGGMIAKEVGILAPGIEKPGFLSASRYAFLDTPSISNPVDCGDDDFIENFIDNVDLNANGVSDSADEAKMSPLFQPDSEDCALTINYDERMRNGGLGYNLISPKNIGRTLTWQIADDASQQVRP